MSEDQNKYESLRVLDLSKKSLKTLPADVARYVNLRELHLAHNELTTLPKFLEELPFLENINISHNKFATFPEVLLHLSTLKKINIAHNAIDNITFIEKASNFLQLEELDVSENPIKELPDALWKLIALKKLNISGIQIGELPKEIGSLRNLETLKMQNCAISSLPEAFGYLQSLTSLNASGNLLNQLPKTFKHLTKLKKINFENNKFKRIVEPFFDVSSLEHLNMSANLLSQLPSKINELSAIKHLNISKNKLKELPNSIYLIPFEKKDFIFKGNTFSRVTQGKISKMFLSRKAENKHLKTPNKKEIVKKHKEKYKATIKKESIEKEASTTHGLVFLLPFIVLIVVLFVMYQKNSKEDPPYPNYEEAYTNSLNKLAKSFASVLARTKEVYVYTNDTATLQLNVKANGKFTNKNFAYHDSRIYQTTYINEFLNDKSLGYSITLDNGREALRQMHVYDSIIPKDSVKLFRISAYFKMRPKEKEHQKMSERLYKTLYNQEERKDTIFGVASGVVCFDELKKAKFNNPLRAFFVPTHLNLNREDYYFYFSPYNGNVSKATFLEAIEYFKRMFIKKGKPEGQCFLKTISTKGLTINQKFR